MDIASARPSRITIPEHAHPLARFLFSEMKRRNCSYDTLEYFSGVLRSTIKSWRNASIPGLDTIEATLGVLGWSVLPVPKPETLPAELRADLEAVAEKHRINLPCLEFVAAAVGRQPNTLLPRSTAEGRRTASGRERRPGQRSLAA